MRARALEIAWHEKTSVWSVDVASADGVTRLVSAGGDKMARVWRLRNTRKSVTSSINTTATGNPLPSPRKSPSDPDFQVEWVCDLRAHTSTVNAVRFAPQGRLLATAADAGEIVIWTLTAPSENIPDPSPAFGGSDTSEAKEKWTRVRTLRGHTHDVLDMAWSPCATYLASASVDNTVMVWTIPVPSSGKSRSPTQLRQSNNFMQGVAFSPDGGRLATLGNDRILRVFRRHRSDKARWDLHVSVSNAGAGTQKLFVDDFNSKNVVRRLSWSPDGNLLACPSGVDVHNISKKLFAVHIFARTALEKPLLQCGGLPKPAIVVRFCPILFKLRKNKPETPQKIEKVEEMKPKAPELSLKAKILAADLAHCRDMEMKRATNNTQPNSAPVTAPPVPSPSPPQPSPPPPTQPSAETETEKVNETPLDVLNYRMVFAVLCTDSLLLYDTETNSRPIARVAGLHLAEQTDLCWTSDGRNLFISSTDGYVSCVSFAEGELGIPLPENEYPKIRLESTMKKQSKPLSMPPSSTATAQAQPMLVQPVRPRKPNSDSLPTAESTGQVQQVMPRKKVTSAVQLSSGSTNQAQPVILQPVSVVPQKVVSPTPKTEPPTTMSQAQPMNLVAPNDATGMEWQAAATNGEKNDKIRKEVECIEVEAQKR